MCTGNKKQVLLSLIIHLKSAGPKVEAARVTSKHWTFCVLNTHDTAYHLPHFEAMIIVLPTLSETLHFWLYSVVESPFWVSLCVWVSEDLPPTLRVWVSLSLALSSTGTTAVSLEEDVPSSSPFSVSTSGFCCFDALKAKSNQVGVQCFIFCKSRGQNVATKTFFTSDFRLLKPPPTNHITATVFSNLLICPNWPIINFDTLDYMSCAVPKIWSAMAAVWICGLFALCLGERLRQPRVFEPQKIIWRDSRNPAA